MNHNPAIQNTVKRAWDGAAAYPADITQHLYFGFSFEIINTLAADAVFKVQAAPASVGDPCVPGAFTDVEEIAKCMGEAVPAGTLAEIRIPAGTLAGAICSGTIPCFPNVFVRLASVSGDTDDVRAYHVLHGNMT